LFKIYSQLFSRKKVPLCLKKTAQSNKSPNRRNFAQSGHSDTSQENKDVDSWLQIAGSNAWLLLEGVGGLSVSLGSARWDREEGTKKGYLG
jgi:hypothetical protein